jgi:hypothetical protein
MIDQIVAKITSLPTCVLSMLPINHRHFACPCTPLDSPMLTLSSPVSLTLGPVESVRDEIPAMDISSGFSANSTSTSVRSHLTHRIKM